VHTLHSSKLSSVGYTGTACGNCLAGIRHVYSIPHTTSSKKYHLVIERLVKVLLSNRGSCCSMWHIMLTSHSVADIDDFSASDAAIDQRLGLG